MVAPLTIPTLTSNRCQFLPPYHHCHAILSTLPPPPPPFLSHVVPLPQAPTTNRATLRKSSLYDFTCSRRAIQPATNPATNKTTSTALWKVESPSISNLKRSNSEGEKYTIYYQRAKSVIKSCRYQNMFTWCIGDSEISLDWVSSTARRTSEQNWWWLNGVC